MGEERGRPSGRQHNALPPKTHHPSRSTLRKPHLAPREPQVSARAGGGGARGPGCAYSWRRSRLSHLPKVAQICARAQSGGGGKKRIQPQRPSFHGLPCRPLINRKSEAQTMGRFPSMPCGQGAFPSLWRTECGQHTHTHTRASQKHPIWTSRYPLSDRPLPPPSK